MASTPSVAQRQFRLPHGLFGRLAGWYMSHENQRLNAMAIDWLDVQPGDDVLEVGSGPGHALELLVERTAARTVTGLDPSPEMIEQATARNRQAAEAGRVILAMGAAESLPFADGQFSRVLAVSNFHVWQNQLAGLREVRRVLREGGRLVICVRRAVKSPWPWTSPGVSRSQLDKDQQQLEAAGFRHVQLATRSKGRKLVCLVAE